MRKIHIILFMLLAITAMAQKFECPTSVESLNGHSMTFSLKGEDGAISLILFDSQMAKMTKSKRPAAILVMRDMKKSPDPESQIFVYRIDGGKVYLHLDPSTDENMPLYFIVSFYQDYAYLYGDNGELITKLPRED